MKKLNYIYTLVFCIILLTAGACKNPAEDVKVVVDMNIIKYSALVHISDANGAIPQNITLSVGGDHGDDIYEISGKKNFTVKDGVITLGLSPSVIPAKGKDVSFNISLNANGYKLCVKGITFSNGAMQQVVDVAMVKTEVAAAPAKSPETAPVTTPVTPPAATTPVVSTTAATPINVSLDFTGYCASKPNLQIRPSLYVFYREKDVNAAYKYLGYIKDGNIQTDKLSMGKTYQFQITYAGENYVVSQLINQTSYTQTFNMGTSVCANF